MRPSETMIMNYYEANDGNFSNSCNENTRFYLSQSLTTDTDAIIFKFQLCKIQWL